MGFESDIFCNVVFNNNRQINRLMPVADLGGGVRGFNPPPSRDRRATFFFHVRYERFLPNFDGLCAV